MTVSSTISLIIVDVSMLIFYIYLYVSFTMHQGTTFTIPNLKY